MSELDADDLWQFSCSVYAKQGVADACICLQNDFGLDVNLLLFAGWAGLRGQPLSEADVVRAEARTSSWRREMIQPLRRMRRWLKATDVPLGRDVGVLLNMIRSAELEAEHVQLTMLQTFFLSEVARSPQLQPFSKGTIEQNIQAVMAADGLKSLAGSVQERVAVIAAAICDRMPDLGEIHQ